MVLTNCIYGSTVGCLGNGRAHKGDKHIRTNYEGSFKSRSTLIVNSRIDLALVSSMKFLV